MAHNLLVVTWASDFNTYLGCGGATNLDMVLGMLPGLDVTIVPDDNAGHSDWQASNESTALGH